MISWANNRHEIQGILAETEETNMASIRVLQKNNFLLLEKKKNMLWWRKEVKLF
jgi:RimJ/RimL family protein N-acetyltransferase